MVRREYPWDSVEVLNDDDGLAGVAEPHRMSHAFGRVDSSILQDLLVLIREVSYCTTETVRCKVT